ncbi:hypothetical protein ACFL3C_02660 [Patescibacteria group bacterium]
MKKLASVFVLLSLFALSGCGDSYPQELSVYSFDTAIIQYEIGGISQGDETVYMRGDQKSSHRFVTTGAQEENTLQLDLGNDRYVADLNKMTATKVKNNDYEKLISMSKEEQEKYLVRKALGLKDSVEVPEPLTTAMVAGQKCKLYEIENIGVACIWEGVVLKKEISILGNSSTKTAVSAEVNVDIAKERFELPAGVILTNE